MAEIHFIEEGGSTVVEMNDDEGDGIEVVARAPDRLIANIVLQRLGDGILLFSLGNLLGVGEGILLVCLGFWLGVGVRYRWCWRSEVPDEQETGAAIEDEQEPQLHAPSEIHPASEDEQEPQVHTTSEIHSATQDEQDTVSSRYEVNRRIKISRDVYGCLVVCFIGKLTTAYLNALPGQVTSLDSFLKDTLPHLYDKKIHTSYNQYCSYFDIRLLIVLASSYPTQIVATLLALFLSSKLGRKVSLLLGTGFFLTTSIFDILWLHDTTMLVAGAVFLNIGIGMANQGILAVKSEIAPDTCPKLIDYATSCGVLLLSLVFYILSGHQKLLWRFSFSLGALFVVILLFITFFFLTESPVFYMEKNKREKARKILQKIKGVIHVEEDLQMIEDKINTYRHQTTLLQPINRPPLVITIVFQIMSYFSVAGIIQNFGPLLLKSADLPKQAPYLPTLVICGIQMFALPLSTVITRRFGRRRPLIAAVILKIISEVTLAIYFWLKSKKLSYLSAPSQMIVPGILYISVDSYLTRSDVWLETTFPTQSKAAASKLTTDLGLLQKALMVFTSVVVLCKLEKSVFFPFLGVDLLLALFIWLLVPETTDIAAADIGSTVWSQHWFWKRYVRGNDSYL